eukprot:19072-Heterococcus_DN1.PRE.1
MLSLPALPTFSEAHRSRGSLCLREMRPLRGAVCPHISNTSAAAAAAASIGNYDCCTAAKHRLQ